MFIVRLDEKLSLCCQLALLAHLIASLIPPKLTLCTFCYHKGTSVG